MGADNKLNGNESPYAAVDVKLKAVVQASPTVPPWHNSWTGLGLDSTDEDRLVVYRAIRQAGALPEAASFWLVSHVIDNIAASAAEDALGQYESQFQSIEEAHGFDDRGVWPHGAAPEGYVELREKYNQAWDGLFARKLEEFGEDKMARLFRDDRQRFEQLTEEGRQYFHGPEIAAELAPVIWLRQLLETVAGCTIADSPMGPLGYRYGEEGGFWEVDVYPTPVERVLAASVPDLGSRVC